MKRLLTIACSAAAVAAFATYLLPQGNDAMADADKKQPQLAHMVYFTLKDSTAENRNRLVASCDKYLSDHPGTVYYSAGTRCEELTRDVNDREFDVALHVVFATKADHDRYQTAEKHLAFIAENRDDWKQVRVFDSYVAAK